MSKGYKLLHFLFAWIFKLSFRIKVVNKENEPSPEKSYILCANHISAFDPILLCAALKKIQPRYMAKSSLFKIPLLSSLIKAFGAYPVDRTGSALGAIKRSTSILASNRSIGIFPQGHRYPGVSPRNTEVKNGIGMICAAAKCDILPVCIKTKNNRYFPFFRRTYIIIGKPIAFVELPINDEMTSMQKNKAITQYAFDRVCSLGEAHGSKN